MIQETAKMLARYKALGIPIAAGAIMLHLLRRRDVNPVSLNRRRNEGHTRMDAARYDHLYQQPPDIPLGPHHG